MVNLNNQSPGIWYDGIALVRIMVGVMLVFHGWQLFETSDMKGYADLLSNISIPFPEAMAYTGKLIELIGGLLLVLGLLTSLVTTSLFLTFIFITFVIGEGDIFTGNQLPFMFAMFSLLFFFTGPGRFSIDYILFINRKNDQKDTNAAVNKRFGQYVSKS
ncbi:MAG: DoxX family membrane protein [Chryseosolibacter sp.]